MTRSPLAILTVVFLAFILRVLFLGDKSVWLDEATSVFLARSDLAGVLRSDIHALLYYRLLGVWLWFGDSEAAIRSLSVVWSVATVPVIFALGRRLYGVREGLIAALLLAVNAFHIAYAQEARSYSQAVFFVSLASLVFLRAVEQPSAQRWAAYALAMLLAIFTHGYALLIIGAHLVSLIFMRPNDVPWKSVALSLGTVALLAIPSLAVAASFGARGAAWIPPIGVREVYDMLRSLAGLAEPPLLLAYLLFFVLGMTDAARTWATTQASPTSFRHGLPVAWFAVPLLVAYAASSFIPVLPRYLMISLPGLVLVVAAGVARVRPAVLFVVVLAVAVGLGLDRVRTYYCCAMKEEWRGAAAVVLSRARDGDAILFYSPYVRPAFEYYQTRLARAGKAPPLHVVPDPDDLSATQKRVWLVVSHDETVGHTASRRIHDTLARRYGSFVDWRFNGVTVFLFPNPERQ